MACPPPAPAQPLKATPGRRTEINRIPPHKIKNRGSTSEIDRICTGVSRAGRRPLYVTLDPVRLPASTGQAARLLRLAQDGYSTWPSLDCSTWPAPIRPSQGLGFVYFSIFIHSA